MCAVEPREFEALRSLEGLSTTTVAPAGMSTVAEALGGPPAAKSYRYGTDRVVSPERTLARARPLWEAAGITRVANLTGLDSIGIPTVAVCRPNARSLSVSQGKGLTLAAAKASGVMESIEAYHAEHVQLPLLLASQLELRARRSVVEVTGLPRLSVSQYRDDLRLLWVEGWDVMAGCARWLPYDLVHMDYTLPLPTGSGAFFMSSNGLASGNHLLEAVSHGICEVVERDANTLFHAMGEVERSALRIDPETIDDDDCQKLLAAYRAARVDVAIWETTSDIPLPSYLCTVADHGPDAIQPLPPTTGSGCHPMRAIALARALTEAAQGRLTLISGSRDDLGGRYDRASAVDRLAKFRASYAERPPSRSFRSAPNHDGPTLQDDIALELDGLRSAGITQVVAVDLTLPAFGIPVVRIVIPGLEAMSEVPGYMPGERAARRLARRPQ